MLGTVIFIVFNFPSEEDDQEQVISNVVSPHQEVGKLEVIWTALPIGHDGDDAFDESLIEEIQDEKDLLGKPWNYKIEIKGRVIWLSLFKTHIANTHSWARPSQLIRPKTRLGQLALCSTIRTFTVWMSGPGISRLLAKTFPRQRARKAALIKSARKRFEYA